MRGEEVWGKREEVGCMEGGREGREGEVQSTF